MEMAGYFWEVDNRWLFNKRIVLTQECVVWWPLDKTHQDSWNYDRNDALLDLLCLEGADAEMDCSVRGETDDPAGWSCLLLAL